MSKILYNKLGDRVKNKIKINRTIKNLTQKELAEKVGVSRQTINYIENNRYIPSVLLALKISKVLEKSIEELFQLEEGE